MTIRIEIQCDNAAFHEDDDTGDNEAAAGAEVARILRELAGHLADGVHERRVFDFNGNRVGSATVQE